MQNAKNFDRASFRKAKVDVRSTYIDGGGRDETLLDELRAIVENIEDFKVGAASPRRCLFVTGPAGTGKTTVLRHLIKKIPEFQPYVDEHKRPKVPFLYIKAKKQSSCKNLVAEVVSAYGLPAEGSEKVLTELMFDLIKERETLCIQVDEIQHAIRANSQSTFEAVQDLLKTMVVLHDWLLHLILSGVPKIEKLRHDEQIGRRSVLVPFHRLQCPDDADWVHACLKSVAVDGCGLQLHDDLEGDDFLGRLCHAVNGAWGTLIEMIQAASFRCMEGRHVVLAIKHSLANMIAIQAAR
jgi:energy-coupling factor transporter ATP-binding protein EcfA2